MEILKSRQSECVATLEREKMIFESVFSFYRDGRLYLSWFSLQQEGHASVATSSHEIDVVHRKYWDECIDASFEPENHEHLVSFIPPGLAKRIQTMYD